MTEIANAVTTMTTERLDITGPVSPRCMLVVQKKGKSLTASDELIITCDSFPALTTQIPRIAREAGLCMETHQRSPGLWEITLTKKSTRGDHHGPDP